MQPNFIKFAALQPHLTQLQSQPSYIQFILGSKVRVSFPQITFQPLYEQIEKNYCIASTAYSSCFMHVIVASMRLPFFKIFSNFVHFCRNFQIFCPFLPFSEKPCPCRTFQNKHWLHLPIHYLSITYFISCTTSYTMRRTGVPFKATRSPKLRGAQHSPELGLRSKEFCALENLIFPALVFTCFCLLSFRRS